MTRCNELCTKETTGQCALCDALAERDRFIQFWFRGGFLSDGVQALRSRGGFAFLHQHVLLLAFLFCVGLALSSTWFIPRSPEWRAAVSSFLNKNPFFVVALIVSLVVPVLWFLLWKVPQRQVVYVYNAKDRLDLESKARQTMAQILGGAALLVGLYFTSQTLRTSQEGQITDRFTKAIDQLGKDSLAVRLGGIYALERIANDSAYDRVAVIEVLTAFVREKTRVQTITSAELLKTSMESQGQERSEPSTDIQAILDVLGHRIRRDGHLLHLGGTQLQGAILHGANLQGAHLAGANLQEAHLSTANLQGASLTRANLQKTFLIDANLQEAYLSGANLQEANLIRANLQEADLLGANLQKAHIWVAKLQKANLTGANLQKANLTGANLQKANLTGANLQKTVLELVNFQEANLAGADLWNAEHLKQYQVDEACVDEHTQLPEGLTKPTPCPAEPKEFEAE